MCISNKSTGVVDYAPLRHGIMMFVISSHTICAKLEVWSNFVQSHLESGLEGELDKASLQKGYV